MLVAVLLPAYGLGPAWQNRAAALSAIGYICFFDTDSAELSPRCQMVLLEAVAWRERTERSRMQAERDGVPWRTGAVRLEVTGHADRDEGARGGGDALSRDRATAVVAFLVLNGVPATMIAPAHFGDARPLVPSPSGAAEAQNRRVEILPR